jgi:alginate O-acetyltransferase complex protein AlgI
MLNLSIIFFLTGLWHGASWNFVIWGLYYAVLTIVYRLAAAVVPERVQTLPGVRFGKILLMFALTNLGWLIFREQNMDRLWRDLTLSPGATPPGDWRVAAYLTATISLYALPLVLHAFWDVGLRSRVERWAAWPRVGWCVATAVSVMLFTGILVLRSNTTQDFIYFQF